jgi:hypothetical protein
MTAYADILELNARFAWLIDHKGGEGVPELFAEDGSYGMGSATLTGREQIKWFYDMRKNRGERTSRHVFSPVALHEVSDTAARGTTILTLFAHDGPGPHGSDIHMIADYEDEYLRGANGLWLYKSRKVVPVFGEVPFQKETAAQS